MFDVKDILNTLSDFKIENKRLYGIEDIGLYNIKDNSKNSKLDVYVKLKKANLFILFDIKNELEKVTNLPVDLVQYRDDMNSEFKESILNDSISA